LEEYYEMSAGYTKILARYQWTKIVKNLKNRRKQPCFDQIQQVDIKDIDRISAGYHELSPLGCVEMEKFLILTVPWRGKLV